MVMACHPLWVALRWWWVVHQWVTLRWWWVVHQWVLAVMGVQCAHGRAQCTVPCCGCEQLWACRVHMGVCNAQLPFVGVSSYLIWACTLADHQCVHFVTLCFGCVQWVCTTLGVEDKLPIFLEKRAKVPPHLPPPAPLPLTGAQLRRVMNCTGWALCGAIPSLPPLASTGWSRCVGPVVCVRFVLCCMCVGRCAPFSGWGLSAVGQGGESGREGSRGGSEGWWGQSEGL